MMDKGDLVKGLLILVFSYIYIDYLKHDEKPLVEVENGFIRGIFSSSSENRGRYKAFMGIPFAASPTGNRRFESPQPAENWSGIRDASYYRSQCIMLDILFSGWVFGSEDCLFLNVFVPINLTPQNSPLPVLVFIHGGYWHVGSSQDHGEKRFMSEDVILVTVNYRLGALGFLSTGDRNVRGNMGLKDQTMALQWVKRNIERFNGDKNRVTIFGESVGAVSVALHILSPASKGLFQRALSQSGSALNLFARNSFVKKQSKHFASKLNCPIKDNAEMVKCLKSLDASTIVSAHREAFDIFGRNRMSMFAATVETINDDQAFLAEEPEDILKRGDFPKIPWISGVNAHEGSFNSAGVRANKTKQEILKNWKTGFPSYFWYKRNDQVSSKIRDYYFNPSNASVSHEDYLRNLTDAMSDRAFYQPLTRAAMLYSKHAETYLYYYNHKGHFSLQDFFADRENYYTFPAASILFRQLWRTFQEFVLRFPVTSELVGHGDELPILFSQPWTPSFMSALPERDAIMSRNLIRLWTSFAKSWDTLVFADKVTWTQVNSSTGPLKYLEISSKPSMIDDPFQERVKFWDSIENELEDTDSFF